MNREILYNVVYGQAVADAVGYYTEFAFHDQLKKIFSSPELFTFPPSRDLINRNRRPIECDWTDDTDHLILLMDMLTVFRYGNSQIVKFK